MPAIPPRLSILTARRCGLMGKLAEGVRLEPLALTKPAAGQSVDARKASQRPVCSQSRALRALSFAIGRQSATAVSAENSRAWRL